MFWSLRRYCNGEYCLSLQGICIQKDNTIKLRDSRVVIVSAILSGRGGTAPSQWLVASTLTELGLQHYSDPKGSGSKKRQCL